MVFLIMSLILRLKKFFLTHGYRWIEYLLGTVFAPNSILFSLLKVDYYFNFDRKIRQSKTVNDPFSNESADWQNPKIFGKNRLKPHSSSYSFDTTSDAFEYWKKRSISPLTEYDNRCYLTGKAGTPDHEIPWKFKLFGSPNNLPSMWFSEEFDDSAWVEIGLPNHWQLQSYDIPIYTNTAYPFRFDPPYTVRDGTWTNTLCDLGLGAEDFSSRPVDPKEPGWNATGLFRRHFELPLEWLEELNTHRFFIVFEGVDSNLNVWLNNTNIGYSQDSCLPAEFEVTDILTAVNLLSISVCRWCDGSYLEDQDKWWLSGIYREVYLTKKPKSLISDFEFHALPQSADDKNCKSYDCNLSVLVETAHSGQFSLLAEIFNVQLTEKVYSSKLELYSKDEKLPSQKNCEQLTFPVFEVTHNSPCEKRLYSQLFSLSNILLWSDEQPNLYVLFITLQINDRVIYIESCQIGFKSIRVCHEGQGRLLINGQPIIIAGINRHEFCPNTGRAVSKQTMITDALLLKSLNFNAVRCAHYPPHPFWLEICDEIGLYVIDEANIETHGFQLLGQPVGFLADQEDWIPAFLARISRMVERDKNHISVISWSLGNESGVGKAHEIMADWLHLRDKTRFVHYESGGATSSVTDIICPMYQRPSWCLAQYQKDGKKRPVVLCEYAHAMGNSGGCLKNYWKLFRDPNFPGIQGGFVWDMIDQGLQVSQSGKSEFFYGGDFNDFPNTHHFCCNGILSADRAPFPVAFTLMNLQSPVLLELTEHGNIESIMLTIFNRCFFSTLNDVIIFAELKYQPDIFDNADVVSHLEINCAELNINPQSKFELCLRELFTCNSSEHDPLIYNATGFESLWVNFRVVKRLECQRWNFIRSCSKWPYFAKDDENCVTIYENSVEFSDTFLKEFLATRLATNDTPEHHNHMDINFVNAPLPQKFSNPSHSAPVQIFINNFHQLGFADGSKRFQILFNKLTGELTHYLVYDFQSDLFENILCKPLDICLYRAPIDNDYGGGLFSYVSLWKMWGYHELTRKENVSFSWKIDFENNRSCVSISWVVKPANVNSGLEIPCSAEYVLYPNGVFDVTMSVTPASYLPYFPRVGIRFALSPKFTQVSWFGLGPHESYDDRTDGVHLDVFNSDIENIHTPYIFPQENGRRTSPR